MLVMQALILPTWELVTLIEWGRTAKPKLVNFHTLSEGGRSHILLHQGPSANLKGVAGGVGISEKVFLAFSGFSDGDEAHPDNQGANPLDFDVCGSIKDVSEPRMPLTQNKRLVPYYGIHRDKESLVEEVELLLNAFQDQKYHFRSHKLHHEAVEALNRFFCHLSFH